jgi:hypothetical protein
MFQMEINDGEWRDGKRWNWSREPEYIYGKGSRSSDRFLLLALFVFNGEGM